MLEARRCVGGHHASSREPSFSNCMYYINTQQYSGKARWKSPIHRERWKSSTGRVAETEMKQVKGHRVQSRYIYIAISRTTN